MITYGLKDGRPRGREDDTESTNSRSPGKEGRGVDRWERGFLAEGAHLEGRFEEGLGVRGKGWGRLQAPDVEA